MVYTRSIFSQFLQWIPRLEFQKAVNTHNGDHRVRKLRTWSQFVALLFGKNAAQNWPSASYPSAL